MKERPILMHARSIQGILAGRKTMTRRIVKYRAYAEEGAPVYPAECPYGRTGDRLWVRETFYCDTPGQPIEEMRKELYYRADVPSGKFEDAGYWGEPGSYWKPSIFMPRWASRLTLEIIDIRVERVQDITCGDITAEGVLTQASLIKDRLRVFKELWDDTNGKGAWERNDWVWVVSFQQVRK